MVFETFFNCRENKGSAPERQGRPGGCHTFGGRGSAAKAREVELMRAVEASRVQMSATEDQALVAFACMLSLEEERQRTIAPNLVELRAEAEGRLHKDEIENAKELEKRKS